MGGGQEWVSHLIIYIGRFGGHDGDGGHYMYHCYCLKKQKVSKEKGSLCTM